MTYDDTSVQQLSYDRVADLSWQLFNYYLLLSYNLLQHHICCSWHASNFKNVTLQWICVRCFHVDGILWYMNCDLLCRHLSIFYPLNLTFSLLVWLRVWSCYMYHYVCSSEETFLQYFLGILKRMVHNL